MNANTEQEGWTVNGKRATFNTSTVWRWFKRLGGKEISSKENPALTPKMKKTRNEWCKEMKKLMEKRGKNFHACFLDNK